MATCLLAPRARVATKARIERGISTCSAGDWIDTIDVELGELLVALEAAICGPKKFRAASFVAIVCSRVTRRARRRVTRFRSRTLRSARAREAGHAMASTRGTISQRTTSLLHRRSRRCFARSCSAHSRFESTITFRARASNARRKSPVTQARRSSRFVRSCHGEECSSKSPVVFRKR